MPVLIIASKNNDFLPVASHALHYGKEIRGAQLKLLEGNEGHFVYLDSCHSDVEAIGVPICKDRDGVDRAAVQKQLYPLMFSFIYRNQFGGLNDERWEVKKKNM